MAINAAPNADALNGIHPGMKDTMMEKFGTKMSRASFRTAMTWSIIMTIVILTSIFTALHYFPLRKQNNNVDADNNEKEDGQKKRKKQKKKNK